MSELEELLRQHTDNVDAALAGFEGRMTTVNEAIAALQAETQRYGSEVIPAHARRGSIVKPGDRMPAENFQPGNLGLGDRRNLSITNEAREELGAIMRGSITMAMREASDPDGGYLVPEVIRDQIEALVLKQSPFRRISRVVDFLQSPRMILPVNMRGANAGWVGENEDREETDTPELGTVSPPGGTLYALPSATEEVVDDAIINLEQFLEENVVDAFAEAESEAFTRGDGIRKPAGFLTSGGPPTNEVDSVRKLGTLQYIPGGLTAGISGAGVMQGALVSMVFSLKAGYRQAPGCSWVASTQFLSTLARLKDGEDRPLYVPSLREGVPGMLLGYPVEEAEHMDAVADGNFPIAFGNWQRGYVIGDRTQLSVLRDPYQKKGTIFWYFRKRVHGAVLNSEALKVLKMAEG